MRYRLRPLSLLKWTYFILFYIYLKFLSRKFKKFNTRLNENLIMEIFIIETMLHKNNYNKQYLMMLKKKKKKKE